MATLAQARAAEAWAALAASAPACLPRKPEAHRRWLRVRWGVEEFAALSTAQARHAARQLNAWRHHCGRR